MKRLSILTAIAVLAVTSCARDEIKTVNKGHAIDFKVVETKGDIKQYSSDMDHFYVTAFSVRESLSEISPFFTDVYFGRLGDYFTSSPNYYWPADGSLLFFFAYTPDLSGTGTIVNQTAEKREFANFAPATDINDQIDLMTAAGFGTMETNEAGGVSLPFSHTLARIQVRAYENNSEYDYSVTGVHLANFASEGTLVTTAVLENSTMTMEHDWTLEDGLTTYFLEYGNTPISISSYQSTLMYNDDSDNRDYNDALVIPQTLKAWDPGTDLNNTGNGAYIAINLQITATASGTQIFPATPGEYGWVAVPVPNMLVLEAGNTYYFNLNLTNGAGYTDPEEGEPEKVLGDDIRFTVMVNEVEDASEGAIVRKELEGNWLATKVYNHYVYPDDYTGSHSYSDYTYDTPEDVEDYFSNNGFYQFTVDNNYNITTTDPQGNSKTGAFTVDDDGNIYLDSYKTGDSYSIIPQVYEIDTEAQTCTIYLIDRTYSDGVYREQYIYYDRK